MTNRGQIGIAMATGLVWAILVLWIGAARVNLPVFSLLPSLAFAFLGPGIVLMLMIGRLAQRQLTDGDDASERAGIDREVLTDTVEQLVLALCLWPPVAYLTGADGPGIVVALGIGFVFARLAYWAGAHISPPLKAFGFAATFYPTILATLYALWSFAT